jgi:hemolysin activation/secretion protein
LIGWSDRITIFICLHFSFFVSINGMECALATSEEQLVTQLTPPPAPALNSDSPNFSNQITVTRFEFQGQTVFSEAELAAIIVPGIEQEIGSIRNRSFSVSQLLPIATQVADLYAAKGYKTSGAIIVVPEVTQANGKGAVVIKVIEGSLEEIRVAPEADVKGTGSLNNYVRSRLKVKPNSPLNVELPTFLLNYRPVRLQEKTFYM